MQSNNCPDSSLWQSFLAGTLLTADKTAAESHLSRCRNCREHLIAVVDARDEARFEETAPSSLKRRVTQRPGQSLRPYLPLALAASVVLAVGFSLFVYRSLQSNSVTPNVGDLRQSNSPTNNLSLTSPPNGAQLNAGPVNFGWMDAGNGVRYEFTLTDERGEIVANEKLTTSTLLIDTAKLRLTPQRTYYWFVSARLPDGSSRESGIAAFTLR